MVSIRRAAVERAVSIRRAVMIGRFRYSGRLWRGEPGNKGSYIF